VWTDLQEMNIKGVFLVSELHPSFASPPSSGVASRRFKLDLSSLLCSFYPKPTDFLARFEKELETRMGSDNGEGRGSLVVVVKNEGAKEEAEVAVGRISDRWRALFSVELEV